jgi:hypothetical protein
MGVATNHRLDPGSRYAGEVISHQGGGSAQKSIGRGQHSADPDGNETFKAAGVRLLDEINWVHPVFFRPPAAQLATFYLVPERTTSRPSLSIRWQRSAQFAWHIFVPIRTSVT